MKTPRSRRSVKGAVRLRAAREKGHRALKAHAFPAPTIDRVVLSATEFTSISPLTGQREPGTVTIEYVPGKLCLELRSLEAYLRSFAPMEAFCEAIAVRIADDIVTAIDPAALTVRVSQNVPGGTALTTVANRTRKLTLSS